MHTPLVGFTSSQVGQITFAVAITVVILNSQQAYFLINRSDKQVFNKCNNSNHSCRRNIPRYNTINIAGFAFWKSKQHQRLFSCWTKYVLGSGWSVSVCFKHWHRPFYRVGWHWSSFWNSCWLFRVDRCLQFAATGMGFSPDLFCIQSTYCIYLCKHQLCSKSTCVARPKE